MQQHATDNGDAGGSSSAVGSDVPSMQGIAGSDTVAAIQESQTALTDAVNRLTAAVTQGQQRMDALTDAVTQGQLQTAALTTAVTQLIQQLAEDPDRPRLRARTDSRSVITACVWILAQ